MEEFEKLNEEINQIRETLNQIDKEVAIKKEGYMKAIEVRKNASEANIKAYNAWMKTSETNDGNSTSLYDEYIQSDKNFKQAHDAYSEAYEALQHEEEKRNKVKAQYNELLDKRNRIKKQGNNSNKEEQDIEETITSEAELENEQEVESEGITNHKIEEAINVLVGALAEKQVRIEKLNSEYQNKTGYEEQLTDAIIRLTEAYKEGNKQQINEIDSEVYGLELKLISANERVMYADKHYYSANGKVNETRVNLTNLYKRIASIDSNKAERISATVDLNLQSLYRDIEIEESKMVELVRQMGEKEQQCKREKSKFDKVKEEHDKNVKEQQNSIDQESEEVDSEHLSMKESKSTKKRKSQFIANLGKKVGKLPKRIEKFGVRIRESFIDGVVKTIGFVINASGKEEIQNLDEESRVIKDIETPSKRKQVKATVKPKKTEETSTKSWDLGIDKDFVVRTTDDISQYFTQQAKIPNPQRDISKNNKLEVR